MYLNIIKAICDNPQPLLYSTAKQNKTKPLKAVPLRSRTRQWCQLSLLLVNTVVLELLNTTIKQEKERKDIQVRKKEVKIYLEMITLR